MKSQYRGYTCWRATLSVALLPDVQQPLREVAAARLFVGCRLCRLYKRGMQQEAVPMSRVLIADDHAVVRAGIRQFLEEEPSITEIGESGSGNETLDQLRATNWDLVMLDIHMPDRSGLDILKQVRVSYPQTSILMMSGLPERQYALTVLKAGASGYLAKGSPPAELLRAVRDVLRGRRYVSEAVGELLLDDMHNDRDQPAHSRLSEREFQIFCKLAAGRTVSDIAEELFLSVKTISTYRTRVLEKLNFSSNAELTMYAIRNEIIR